MITPETFRQLALSFPDTVELPHFERTSFRVKQKIFATLAEDTKIATLKLSAADQSFFCSFDRSTIYPVPNKWGAQGWTLVELNKVPEGLVKDALEMAYREVVK